MRRSMRVLIISLLLMTGALLIFDCGSFQCEGAENIRDNACENTRAKRSGDAVAEWHFEDGSGQVVSDSSGNGNDGQLGSTSGTDDDDPTWVDGVDRKALRFDGIDDGVYFDNDIDITDDYSISAWFKTSVSGTVQEIIAFSGGCMNIELREDGELRYLHREPPGNSGGWNIYTTTSYNDGIWHYVTAIKDGSNIRLYVDGIEVGRTCDNFGWTLCKNMFIKRIEDFIIMSMLLNNVPDDLLK